MLDLSLKEFIGKLSTSEPVPGGGGAAALAGALSSALCSMVASLTSGKKKYAEYQKDIERILRETADITSALESLIDKDAECFEPLSRAYGIPKDDPQRDKILEEALRTAAEAPYEILKAAALLLPVLKELTVKGSAIAVSDVGTSAALCEAAVKSAALNVYINTKLMKDRLYADNINKDVYRQVAECLPICSEVYESVAGRLMQDASDTESKLPVKELRGAPVAAAITEKCITKTAELREKGIIPTLAIVRMGAREDDEAYERGAQKRFLSAGAEVVKYVLPEKASQEELENIIRDLNADTKIHGILIFRPLPKHIDEERVKRLIDMNKDVDCMSYEGLGGLAAAPGDTPAPCTPRAVIEMLDFYNIDIAGKKITIVGRSPVVGLPLAVMLIRKSATVTVCHTKTRCLADECAKADIIISCAGRAGIIDAAHISEGQILIDVGINFKDGKMCGDIDYEAAVKKACAVTPVPGGVGAVTTSVLLKQTVDSALKLC